VQDTNETANKQRKTPFRSFFLYGLLGGAIANIGSYVGTSLLGLPYPPEAVFQLLIAPVPGSIQSVIVETFREYAKYGTFAFVSVAYTLLYGIIAVIAGHLSRGRYFAGKSRLIMFATVCPTLIGLALQALLAARVSTLSSVSGWLAALSLMLIVNLAYAAVLVDLTFAKIHRLFDGRTSKVQAAVSSSRRGFLKKVGVAAVVLAVAGIAARIGMPLFSGQPVVRSNTPIPINDRPASVDLDELPAIFRDPRISDLVGSEISDNRVFYRVDINPVSPQLSFDQWALKVSGKVNSPLTIDKEHLLAIPAKDEYATLECVSNTINPPGALISNAKWSGVPLADVLTSAGVTPDAKSVVFRCADGYSVGIPLDLAMRPGSLLAYKMNDEFLPQEHGSPLRAIVPGIYGMMNAKWITEIEALDNVYLGYWQQRGWSNDAKIKTTSIIYYPAPNTQMNGTLPIAGIAFAGDRGIQKVEVSTDGGNTWNGAIIKTSRSPYSWVLWAYEWTPDTKGNHTIIVRATDGNNQLQDPTNTLSFPDGASGYHSIQVTVT